MGFEIGDRVKICKVAYPTCTEDGYPFLEPGNFGIVRWRYPHCGVTTCYEIVMENDPDKSKSWVFYQNELESE